MRPHDDEDAFACLVPPTIECNALMMSVETVPYTNAELLARWRALALTLSETIGENWPRRRGLPCSRRGALP